MPGSAASSFTEDSAKDESNRTGEHKASLRDSPPVEDVAREAIGPLSDDERLRMLGYDVQLGRPLGFWSSAGLNVSHNSFVTDFISWCALYAYPGPLLFVICYPVLAILHFCLIGPFAELVSAFPVAGGMATWSWYLAHQGIRGDRVWGWFVSGFTLAMHLGKIISYLYAVATSLTQIYISLDPKVKVNPITQEALNPQDWWQPVFYLSLITFVTLLCLTRVARNGYFWMFCGFYNVFLMLLVFAMLCTCAVKVSDKTKFPGIKPIQWGFPTRKTWMYSFSRMIFMGIPLRVLPIDAPIHMAEETRNTSRTVPRVMWVTSLYHYISVYVTVTMFIVIVIPVSHGMLPSAPVIPLGTIMGVGIQGITAFSILATLGTVTQVLASTLITSRFIFALARDHGIPFSRWLVKTSKDKEPWVAMSCLLISLYLSTLGWLIKSSNYYRVLQAFNFYFIGVAYVLPLILYVTSRVDLVQTGRPEFTLRGFSRPLAWIAIVWLCLSLIQGSFPLTEFQGSFYVSENKKEVIISFLPMVIGGMVVVMLVSWFLYGRRYYVGPIRALTRWAGVEVDPSQDHSQKQGGIVRQYMENKPAPRPSGSDEPVSPNRASHSGGSGGNGTKVSNPASKIRGLFGRRSSSTKRNSGSHWSKSTPPGASAFPESDIFPHQTTRGIDTASVIPESGIFPCRGATDEGEVSSAAQAESQLLPASNRGSRVLKLGGQSYPLTQLSPPPRSKKHRSLYMPGWGATEEEPAALQESQLQPTGSFGSLLPQPAPTRSGPILANAPLHPSAQTNSFGDRPALPESQIEPNQTFSFNEPTGIVVSLPGPSEPEQTFVEPAALQESQLQPSWEESFTEPAALQESQLEPRI